MTPKGVFKEAYRGFRLGWIDGEFGYKAMYRSSLESRWMITHIWVDTLGEVEIIAKKCINFVCHSEALRIATGRELSIDDIINFPR